MTLTDTRIRNAKPSDKVYKLSDAHGMYLFVKPDGGRYWRLDYRFAAKRRTLALGVYPTVTLSDARARREEARRLLFQILDPANADVHFCATNCDWVPFVATAATKCTDRCCKNRSARRSGRHCGSQRGDRRQAP